MSELNLLELWFAATCGVELPAQHRSNDSPSLDTAIAVGMDTSKSHSLLFDGLQNDHFRCLAVDPPWLFKSNSEAKPGRNARRHYRCMTHEEIAALPVGDYAAANAALFLWITGPLLVVGAHLPIMKAWGFKPSGMGFVWIKLNPKAASLFILKTDLAIGGGFTTRKNAEFCVIGKRGLSVRRDAGIHEIIISPRREHSRKPDEFYERVERYSDGPRLELFGRQQRTGWTVRGDEAEKFGRAA